jgi:Type VI secretion system (T6SS), amidase effector protein 4
MNDKVAVEVVSFSKLLGNFPSGKPCDATAFPDQCAIRVGEALSKCGVSLASFSGSKCWFNHGHRHPLRAEELAGWLRRRPFPGCGQTQSMTPANFQAELNGKTGIIFLKDYWQRGQESAENRSGDHIDLWNNNSLAAEWTRFDRGIAEFFGAVSDLNRSKAVQFWEIV